MENEKLRILKLLETGKISSEEAVKLLEAIDAPEESAVVRSEPASLAAKKKKKWLKIRVYEGGNMDKPKVNVKIPLGLVKFVSKVLPKDAKIQLESKNIDLDEILAEVDQLEDGKLVEVHDEKDNEHVEIVIE